MLGFFRIFAVKKQIILQYLTLLQTAAMLKGIKKQLIMRRYLFVAMLSLFITTAVSAQDDDMYFTPKHKDKNAVVTPPRSRVTEAYDYSQNNDTYHSGSIRDVDEYNRHGKGGSSSSSTWREGDYAQDDSVLVSREDYENSRRMKRFDGYNSVTLIVGDPWYYDSWYYDPWYGGSYYWRTRWYDPWYYSYYDPWYYGGGWYAHWGPSYYWHRPYYGHGGWHGGGFHPAPGRPGGNVWAGRVGNYTTNRPGTRIFRSNTSSRNVNSMLGTGRDTGGQGVRSNIPEQRSYTPIQRNTTRQYAPVQQSQGSFSPSMSRGGGGGFSGGGRSMGGGGSRGVGRR